MPFSYQREADKKKRLKHKLAIETGATMSPLDQVQAIKTILNKQRSISQVSEAEKASKAAIIKENKRLYENIINIKT